MKEFEGQYSDEKLLLKKHEHWFSFICDKTHLFAVYLVLGGVVFGIIQYITKNFMISGLFAIVALLILFFYLRNLYKNTWLIFTTRRVLELTKNGLLVHNKKELKLSDIKAHSSRRGTIGSILGFGSVVIKGTEESANIYFKGVKGNTDIVNYLGRVLDYIKLNGHTDDIARYVDKKDRKKNK